MPMNFPDMKSLKDRADQREFRMPEIGESEEHYREAFAEFMSKVDFVESCEIRNKVGWDKFSDSQSIDMVIRKING